MAVIQARRFTRYLSVIPLHHIMVLVHGMGSLGNPVMACIRAYEVLVLPFGVFFGGDGKTGLLHGRRGSLVDDGTRK